MIPDLLPVCLVFVSPAQEDFVSLAELEDSLLRNLFRGYQKWVRPVQHANDTITVRFGLKISQLVDVVRPQHMCTQTTQGRTMVRIILIYMDRMSRGENLKLIRAPSSPCSSIMLLDSRINTMCWNVLCLICMQLVSSLYIFSNSDRGRGEDGKLVKSVWPSKSQWEVKRFYRPCVEPKLGCKKHWGHQVHQLTLHHPWKLSRHQTRSDYYFYSKLDSLFSQLSSSVLVLYI